MNVLNGLTAETFAALSDEEKETVAKEAYAKIQERAALKGKAEFAVAIINKIDEGSTTQQLKDYLSNYMANVMLSLLIGIDMSELEAIDEKVAAQERDLSAL
jgi:2-keto-3-deoxy-galactonokinase